VTIFFSSLLPFEHEHFITIFKHAAAPVDLPELINPPYLLPGEEISRLPALCLHKVIVSGDANE